MWLRTELPLRDGSNGATNTEQADLDELGRHLLVELGGHLLVDGGAMQRFARRPDRRAKDRVAIFDDHLIFAFSNDLQGSCAMRCCTGTSNCLSVGASILNAVTKCGCFWAWFQIPSARHRTDRRATARTTLTEE